MNKVILSGRLTRDPESKEASVTVVRFGLAVDRRKGETDFFNVTAFGKTAEAVEKYLRKGTKVVISGRIQMDSYTAHDGTRKSAVQIICEEWEFAESKQAQQAAPAQQEEDFMAIPEDGLEELPFN
jgi:single-strand DNA-binding protein